MLQGGGLFRSGLNGDVSNIFFENNNAALSGGGLFEVRGSSHPSAVDIESQCGRLDTAAMMHQPPWLCGAWLLAMTV